MRYTYVHSNGKREDLDEKCYRTMIKTLVFSKLVRNELQVYESDFFWAYLQYIHLSPVVPTSWLHLHHSRFSGMLV